ncbi:MAG: YraN family protein [Leptolyngbya sp. SIO4C1]|nr:YraN family protein [Leptolyngbya sp. SIO4C1]
MSTQDLGRYGEQLVQTWLQRQGWQILYRRWYSRWGELDLVAKGYSTQAGTRLGSTMLLFVEVKTRSQGNWDADGLLAVTRSKQRKLWTAARLFLTRHPYLAELPCRFDIALVSCSPTAPPQAKAQLQLPNSGCYLILQDYLVDAFQV